MLWVPDENEFLALPSCTIHDLVYPRRLSVSLLLNGTRRWYVSQYFDTPPADNSYFPHYLQIVLEKLTELITMLAENGVYRIFMPVYSWYQPQRNPEAHKYLLKGIEALVAYPALVEVYLKHRIAIHFYGDTSHLPEPLVECLRQTTELTGVEPRHHIYYGVDGGNPYDYTFKLAHEFGMQHGRSPSWEEMTTLYYGDPTLRRLEILIGFNRIYSRGGIPHLLEGGDRIYVTVVTPLVLSAHSLRLILHDYLFNRHDFGRDYKDIHPNEIQRLKSFYAANQDTVVGLVRKYEDLVYPVPAIHWPDGM